MSRVTGVDRWERPLRYDATDARASQPDSRSLGTCDRYACGTFGGPVSLLVSFTYVRTGPCDRDCDQDTSERAERGETGRDCMASSAEASMGVSDRPGRVATAHGLLITQRRVIDSSWHEYSNASDPERPP
jgi:hypothetical protein